MGEGQWGDGKGDACLPAWLAFILTSMCINEQIVPVCREGHIILLFLSNTKINRWRADVTVCICPEMVNIAFISLSLLVL